MKVNIDEINRLLDALYLELLSLIEQQTLCRVNIERTANAGQLLLAKTRYNQGSQAISVAQIPTANSVEFKAICQVTELPNEDKISGYEKCLLHHKVDKTNGYIDPMNWFTVLPSISLRNAAEQYKKSLEFVLESANIQKEMLAVMRSIDHLKSLKQIN